MYFLFLFNIVWSKLGNMFPKKVPKSFLGKKKKIWNLFYPNLNVLISKRLFAKLNCDPFPPKIPKQKVNENSSFLDTI